MTISAEPLGNDRLHAVRVRRFYLAVAAYGICAWLFVVAHLLGLVSFPALMEIVAIGVAINAGLFLTFRNRWNERFADPSLTGAQMALAIGLVMFAVYQFDRDRGLALMICL